MKRVDAIFANVLKEIKPSEEELEEVKIYLKRFLEELKKGIKSNRISAEPFVGGSFAKNTIMKKSSYDIDIFVRFDKKYKNRDISDLTSKILDKVKMKGRVDRIHGSRDYFKFIIDSGVYFEIVPVMKVTNPKDADNITDLSYYHVKYINKKIKSKKLIDDIILAKAFCHSAGVYGAESHIKGFSGYSLELLICHYRGFLKFIKEISKMKDKSQLIIDIAKHYRNKRQILMDLNSSKLESPIVLIDPTYKQRNALATLSEETLEKFRYFSKAFLKSPSMKFFEPRYPKFDEIKKRAERNGLEFIRINATTDMQEGAVAGSKLLKFYNHLSKEISKYFQIKGREFYYNDGKDANYVFVAKRRDKYFVKGPPIKRVKDVEKFRNKHGNNTFVKAGAVFAEKDIKFNIEEFVKFWRGKNKELIKEMYILDLKILDS